ncbi:cytochrome P450 4d1-like isoform X2 [Eupeodes corollae]|uniref:cytochrome P450 4d1-like isoform X2 n=1 Tax=Eupeodes corollae TaxID=290404 RepID=UPI002493B362|nr:cytochrome P450 4d1-like isoform X2 [Eupeodes corollae]
MMFLIFPLVLIILFGFILYQIKYAKLTKAGNSFPGPPNWPILGNAQYFINIPVEDNMRLIGEYIVKYGEVYRVWIGKELNLFFQNRDDLRVIMSGNTFSNKASLYDLMKPWLNEGLLLSKGKKWHNRRKIITPAFHFTNLEEYTTVFEKQSRMLCEVLKKQMGLEAFELLLPISRYTMDVISESAMGVSVNAQTNTDSEYVKAVKTISTVLHKRMFDIFYRFDFTYWFTKLARDEKKALQILHGFTEKIIIQRREEILREKERASQKDTNDVGGKRKMAFLDILLQSEIDGKPLSNLDIREEVDTFMFEGHDTTSSAITFLFYNIARYPETQNKCFQEILETFGKDKNTPVTYEKLNSLHYTELCIKETLRLFPSVPLLGRRVTKECEINGKIVPAGANIGISPLHLGRMEEIFPNANEFIPERFDVVTNAEKMNPYAYIPFSAGPRNCIGQKFAMLEIKSVVANVLRNFEVEYVKSELGEPLLIGELILRTRDPLMFRLKPRIYTN